jgi:cobalt/nickel transport protein
LKTALFVFLLLIGAATMNASGHSMWLESKDQANVGDTERVYALYGHLSDITGITAPMIEASSLLAPDGQKLNLTMNKGDWMTGFGWIGYAFSDVTLYWPGDYVFTVSRIPSVYDPGWSGTAPSNPRLGYSSSKAVIHAGNESGKSWDAGTPMELNPDKAPYDIKAKDNVTFLAKYKGQPVNATYSAFPNSNSSNTQTGSTGEDGSFVVNFNQGGLWQVSANYDIAQGGNWTATYESAGHYKAGDEVPYNTTRYSTVMSIWVRK